MNPYEQTVSLLEMMDARERRSFLQKQLLNQYPMPLISFTLNIPGPIKVLPGIPWAFEAGCSQVESLLSQHNLPIVHTQVIKEKTGFEAFYSVSGPSSQIKRLMTQLEDQDALGRLFDLDVLDSKGVPLSRQNFGFPPRRCLLCSQPAHVCSRSRRHSVAQLTACIRQTLAHHAALRFQSLCAQALMDEVSATPKPGLVDRLDSGAHKDMDFQTFQASTNAIAPWLGRMFAAGLSWEQPEGEGLFAAIRPMGIEAEQAMLQATHGVNTHKGMIFSMGIVAAAAGLQFQAWGGFSPEQILTAAGNLCHDSLEEDFSRMSRTPPKTHGELLFARFQIRGIRGEAQQGFPSIRHLSLPALRSSLGEGQPFNEACLNALLTLMSQVDDTNVLIRTGKELLAYEKEEAARILSLGGASTQRGMDALVQLNQEFIRQNISPGGCADLLAVTILLLKLEQETQVFYKSSR